MSYYPTQAAFPPPNSGQWSTGLCGCFEDFESCVCGLCCPCVLIGRYVEIIDQGATTCATAAALFYCLQCWTGCGCLYSCGYRGRLRQKFGLPATPCGDFLVECCCLNCSVCQVHRELANRGIDPKLGYAAVKQAYDQPQPYQGAPQQQYMGK